MGAAFAGFVILVLVSVAGVMAYARESRQVMRQLAATTEVRLGELVEGQDVRIRGVVGSAGQTIAAPLSGRPCVYFEVIVMQHVNKSWRRIIREVGGVPFVVTDGTGRAIVDANAARIALHKDVETRSGTLDDATPAEEAFLARHDQRSTGWAFNKQLRYREAVIELGETVVVAGRGVREPDPDAVDAAAGYREGPPTRVRMTSTPRFPLLVTDRAAEV